MLNNTLLLEWAQEAEEEEMEAFSGTKRFEKTISKAASFFKVPQLESAGRKGYETAAVSSDKGF